MPFKSEKQRKWMYANDPEMAKKWEKEEAIKGKLRNLIKQEIKSINEAKPKSFKFKFQCMECGKSFIKSLKKSLEVKCPKCKSVDIELENVNEDNIKFSKEEMAQLHKGGKIVGFEAESKNRGRAEKSRLRKEDITMLEAKFTDDTLAPRIKHWASKHKGTGIGYGHVLGQLAVHMKEMGWNKSYKEVARVAIELGKKKKVESVDEGTCGYTHTIDGKKLKTPGGINDDDIDKTESIIVEFDKYRLGGLLDSKLKKRLERAIKIWGGKIDAVGDDYIKFRLSSFEVAKFPALLKKLDKNKNVWIGDKRKNNIWDRRQKINKLEAFKPKGVSLMKKIVFLPKSKLYFDPDNGNFWLMGPYGGEPDWEEDPIEPKDRDYKRTLSRLSSKDKSIMKKSLRGKGNWKEATTSVSVPGYLSPQAFQKSTQNAIDVDDEDDEVKEAYKVDIDKLLQNPKIKKLMQKLGVKKSQSQEGAIKILNYFATNPQALAAFKKLAVGESMAAPFRRRKSRGLGRPMKVGLNESSWSQPLGWSSPEAKVHVDKDITKMSKHLGKTSHDIIKIMMSGVKGGKYDAMDLQRGMKEGDVRRTHYGEMDFIQELWHKVRDGFRRYSKRGKLR